MIHYRPMYDRSSRLPKIIGSATQMPWPQTKDQGPVCEHTCSKNKLFRSGASLSSSGSSLCSEEMHENDLSAVALVTENVIDTIEPVCLT